VRPPPFLVSFKSEQDFKVALGEDVAAQYWNSIQDLLKAKLPPVVSVRALACLFGVSGKFVGALRNNPERYYRVFTIKKGKKLREIQAPKVGLKVFQKWLGTYLAASVDLPATVYGFVSGRSAPMAARVHCNARWVYSFDLADFFPSTPRSRVVSALESLGYPRHGAELAASICCFRGGLAQGSPASPVLSNLVFGREDLRLAQLASEFGLRHTRYADDIVFSGRDEIPDNLADRTLQILNDGGWRTNGEKEHLAVLPHRLKVHGLLVHGAIPRLTKGYRNRLRALRHLRESGRIRAGDSSRILGHLNYARSIEKLDAQDDD
jgi:RNA-directed DNA polymerase